MIFLAHNTGMRGGESLGLRWMAVDLKDGRIFLPCSRWRGGLRLLPFLFSLWRAMGECCRMAGSC